MENDFKYSILDKLIMMGHDCFYFQAGNLVVQLQYGWFEKKQLSCIAICLIFIASFCLTKYTFSITFTSDVCNTPAVP